MPSPREFALCFGLLAFGILTLILGLLCGCGGPRGMVRISLSETSTLDCTPERGWEEIRWQSWQVDQGSWIDMTHSMEVPGTRTRKPYTDAENPFDCKDGLIGPEESRWNLLCYDDSTDYCNPDRDAMDRLESLCFDEDGYNTCLQNEPDNSLLTVTKWHIE
jgi:hypothetical protein